MKLSLITVTFNSGATLESTFQTILSQKLISFEYLIIDGESKDDTLDIIKAYQSQFDLKEIEFRWISEPDNGIYDAMNKGIKLATGDVIGFLNSDDVFHDETALETISHEFEEDPDLDCCYGNLYFVDEKGKKVRDWISREFKSGLFQKSWTPAHPTFYCKKSVYEKYGLYRTDYIISSDVDLMFRFLEVGGIKSKFINHYLVIMSTGGVSTNGLKSTFTITKEVGNSIKEQGFKFILIKYFFFKILKAIEQRF